MHACSMSTGEQAAAAAPPGGGGGGDGAGSKASTMSPILETAIVTMKSIMAG